MERRPASEIPDPSPTPSTVPKTIPVSDGINDILSGKSQDEVPPGIENRILEALHLKGVWLPIPLFLMAICSLLLWKMPGSYESPYLLLALNFVFAMLASLFTAYLAFRAFLISGKPGSMILGCGLLIWGGNTIVATFFVHIGPNELVTVHNLGVFLSAFCHLTAAVLRWRSEATVNAPGLWLTAGITGTVGVTGVVAIAAVAGWTPVFFIPGSGGTPLRQVVLWMSIGMFTLTAWLMGKEYRRSPSAFLRWYASGLSLIAVGLFGVMMQSIPGSIIGWFGRTAQFLPLEQVLRDTQAKLKDQIERYELVLAGANAALWDWDVPNKRVVFSPQWKALRGFDENKAIEQEEAWSESIHPEDRERVFAALQRHFDEKTAAFSEEYRIVCRDGAVKWIFDRGLAKRNATGQVIRMAGSEIEITERKQAEQALRENERRLSLAISATADAIWEWNLATNQTYYSPRWYEMLGYEVNAISMDFDGWKRLCHPDDLQPALDLIQSSLDAGSPGYAAEFRMRSKDGTWIWILGRGRVVEHDEVGKPVLLSGTNTDITERKRGEEELKAAMAKAEEGDRMLTALMESVPEGITICDAAGNIRMTSRHGQNLLGGQHAGKSIEEVAKSWIVYRPDGRTVMPMDKLPLIWALKGETVQNVELIQVNKEGRKLPLLCNAAPIRDATGAIVGGIVAWRDITALKQAEAALREREERLSASLAEKEILLKEIHHRVKNNMQVISSLVDLQADEVKDDAVRGIFISSTACAPWPWCMKNCTSRLTCPGWILATMPKVFCNICGAPRVRQMAASNSTLNWNPFLCR